MADLMSLPSEMHDLIVYKVLFDKSNTYRIQDVVNLKCINQYWFEVVERVLWNSFHSLAEAECGCWACPDYKSYSDDPEDFPEFQDLASESFTLW